MICSVENRLLRFSATIGFCLSKDDREGLSKVCCINFLGDSGGLFRSRLLITYETESGSSWTNSTVGNGNIVSVLVRWCMVAKMGAWSKLVSSLLRGMIVESFVRLSAQFTRSRANAVGQNSLAL